MKKEAMSEAGAGGAGFGIGAAIGSGIGLVGIFGGIAATWPLAVVFGVGGYGFMKIKNLRAENAQLKVLTAQDPTEIV